MSNTDMNPWENQDAAKAVGTLDDTERGTNGFGSTGR